MIDYRKFLGKREEAVLPYFGGAFVEARGRRLRLAEAIEPGFWRFEISGKIAKAIESAESPSLDDLPAVRGHAIALARLVRDGGIAEELAIGPAEELPLFSPLIARRWPTGELIHGQLELEGEAELAVRAAFEEQRAIGDVKGVPATLRAAFGYALAERVGRARGIEVAPIEVRRRVLEIAERGTDAIGALLDRIAAERARAEAERARQRQLGLEIEAAAVRADRSARRAASDPVEVATAALAGSGAVMLAARRLGGGQLEVRFRFENTRFTSVVDEGTLQVIDAGVCLAGADELVTLESLPSVIREAIATDALVITRRE